MDVFVLFWDLDARAATTSQVGRSKTSPCKVCMWKGADMTSSPVGEYCRFMRPADLEMRKVHGNRPLRFREEW